MTDEVKLSVIVTIVGGGRFLKRCLQHLVEQEKQHPTEVIVPLDSTVEGIDELKTDFPSVRFINIGVADTMAPVTTQAGLHELYDVRSAIGLGGARGEIVALLQDYCVPGRSWCEELVEAHQLPYGAIGGAVENKGQGVWNWAAFYLDFGRHQPPLPEGPARYLTDVNVSYKRGVLESVKHLWIGRYKEVIVNRALAQRGVVLWQRPQLVVYQDRGTLRFRDLVRERYHWGRLFGSIRTTELSALTRWVYVALSPAIPVLLILRAIRKVVSSGRSPRNFLRCLPHFAVLTCIWCYGEFVGYLTGRECAP